MPTNSRLLFLLGAGISIPAGLPKTNELTQKILSGGDVILETDGIYYLNDEPSDKYLPDEYVPRIKTFLTRLKREVDSYYKNSRESNYEDIYYLAAQIRDSENGEYDNPALNALIGEIFPDIAQYSTAKRVSTLLKTAKI